jgi:hypothetical protein
LISNFGVIAGVVDQEEYHASNVMEQDGGIKITNTCSEAQVGYCRHRPIKTES